MNKYWHIFIGLLTVIIFVVANRQPVLAQSPKPEVTTQYYQAKVIKITEANKDDGMQSPQEIDVVLQILGGERNGNQVAAYWSNDEKTSRTFQIHEGDKVVAFCTTLSEVETCQITSQVRSIPLIVLGILFLLTVWFVTRVQGLKALVAMGLGLMVILYLVVPLILKGMPPLPVAILGGLAIIVPTIYLSHGFNTRSHISLVSILSVTVIIAVLSLIFSHWLNLVGVANEESLYLKQNINLKAVLLSAILLGTLGVIDDLAVTQVSIVNELYHSNPLLSPYGIYQRAMHIGKSHIASVINTLFLAYAGVSLPLLILLQQNNVPVFAAVHNEQLSTEIMRTLIGTMGLVLVVPLSTYLAAVLIKKFPHSFPPEEHHHAH